MFTLEKQQDVFAEEYDAAIVDVDRQGEAQVCKHTFFTFAHFISDRQEDLSQRGKRKHPRRGRKTPRRTRKSKGKGKETDVGPPPSPTGSSESCTSIMLILPPQERSAKDWIDCLMKKHEYVWIKEVAPDLISPLERGRSNSTEDVWVEMWDWVSVYFAFFEYLVRVMCD